MKVNPGEQAVFDFLKEKGPSTKEDIVQATKFSERTVRNYLHLLFTHNLIKEMPSFGRTKIYAPIDYVPVLNESKPLAQRWQVYSPSANHRFSLGELATYYGNGMPASSIKAAELLLKAPALLSYYAQENELSDEELTSQLESLQEVLKDACDQLQGAISVFAQLSTDPRYWRPDLLRMYAVSPDFPLSKDMSLIINRLREEMEDDNETEQSQTD